MLAASEQPVDRRYGRSGYRDSAAAAGPDDEQRSADHHMPWRWLGTAAASKPTSAFERGMVCCDSTSWPFRPAGRCVKA